MSRTNDHFLRIVMTIDALVGALSSLALIFAAEPLSASFGLSTGFLQTIGIVLAPMTIYMFWVARRTKLSRTSAWTLIGCNALWVIASVLLLLTDWVQPSAYGVAFILSQAVIVGVFAALEYVGMRRLERTQIGHPPSGGSLLSSS